MEKTRYYSTIRKMILISMIFLPAIPFILALGIGYAHFTGSIENRTITSFERIVSDHRYIIESFLDERKSDLELIRDLYGYDHLKDRTNLSAVFGHLSRRADAFVDIGVFDENGLHVAYHGPYELGGKNYSSAPWFTEVMHRDYYISDIFMGFRNIPHFIIAITGDTEDEKWVLRATIDSKVFNELVGKIHIGKSGEAYLLNKKGVFQTTRRSGGNLMEKDGNSSRYLEFHEGVKTFLLKDGSNEFLYAATWMKDKSWLLVIRQSRTDAFQALSSASSLIILVAVVGGGVILAVGINLTNYIINRMQKMDMDKDNLESQLIRSQRLAELGEMSAGFAHEINNPLQIIRSEQALIDMLLSELEESGALKESEQLNDLKDSIGQIKLQVVRCAEITHAILKFGRKTDPKTEKINLYDFIPEITAMISKKASVHGVSIRQDISETIPLIYGDSGQLQQVLLNLYNNAIDAIVERHGSVNGEIIVKADKMENNGVKISVKDNGGGITSENQKRIFTPFFTTKPLGQGTGLGLSVCYGIIKNMNGVLEVSSRPGMGATFTISLPGKTFTT